MSKKKHKHKKKQKEGELSQAEIGQIIDDVRQQAIMLTIPISDAVSYSVYTEFGHVNCRCSLGPFEREEVPQVFYDAFKEET